MTTKLNLINFDDYFDPTKIVTNPEPMKSGEFTNDGIFSEDIFGPEDDMNNLDSIAWITFGDNNKVIHPLIYTRLEKLMTARVVDSLCAFNMRIDINGNFKPELDQEEGKKQIEDANIGLWEFRKNFIHYVNKYTPEERKKYPEYKNVLLAYVEGKAFIDKIPIYSPKLRPAQIFKHDKTFHFSEINKYYNLVIQHSNNLKAITGDNCLEEVQLRKVKILYRLQGYVNRINLTLIDEIKGKRGIIRNNILGGRLNNTSRNVIAPDPDLAVNEIRINYTTFINLYEIPLINLVSVSEGLDYIRAKAAVDHAKDTYSAKMYRYMMELIHKSKGGIRAILNRNPSISVASIQIVKIVDIIPDVDHFVMYVSNNILSGLGADFDGDVLNLIALFSDEQYQEFKRLDPTYQIISNNDGNFSRIYSLTKDSKLAVYLMNHNLSNAKDSTAYEVID